MSLNGSRIMPMSTSGGLIFLQANTKDGCREDQKACEQDYCAAYQRLAA
jgi:hypothetical protein